jgi:hypothetical protein
VAQVLRAKYYPDFSFFRAKPKQQMSFSWRSILNASWILKKGCYWAIGNGNNIDIWEDNWIQQKCNAKCWSQKPHLTNHTLVRDLMTEDGQGWDPSTINQVFIPMEAQKILNLPINYDQEDSIIWDGTTDGNYTVKAGYQAIKDWDDSVNLDAASTSNPLLPYGTISGS